jgi:hypothetical protein
MKQVAPGYVWYPGHEEGNSQKAVTLKDFCCILFF